MLDECFEKSALVIPTRNRPGAINGLLRNLSEVDVMPRYLILVDSSDNLETKQLWEDWVSSKYRRTYYVNSQIGAAHQRNIGLQIARGVLGCEVIFFLDDDIRVQSNYFKISCKLISDPRVNCLGGFDRNQPPTKSSVLRRLLRLADKPNLFRVLPSGATAYGRPQLDLEEAEWVPGGMMTVKSESVTVPFNDSALIYGDDLEFQLLNFRGRNTFVSRLLEVDHLQDQGGKERESKIYENYAHFRWSLRTKFQKVKARWVVIGTLTTALASLSPWSSYRNWQRALGELKFLGKVILGRSHTRNRYLMDMDETFIFFDPESSSFRHGLLTSLI